MGRIPYRRLDSGFDAMGVIGEITVAVGAVTSPSFLQARDGGGGGGWDWAYRPQTSAVVTRCYYYHGDRAAPCSFRNEDRSGQAR
jgi:hypothetical protein